MFRRYVAAVACLIALIGCNQAIPHAAICSRGDEIPSVDRATIDEAALTFVQRIYSGDADDAFASMLPAAQDEATRTSLNSLAEAVQASPGEQRRVAERFMLQHVGAESGQSPCIEGDRVTTLANGGGVKTAFALVVENVQSAERTWTVWLNLHEGGWRVRAFHVGVSGFAGRNSNDLIEEALREERAGHSFNATILLDLANQASNRGSFFTSAERNRVTSLRRDRQRHPDLVGEAPYTFTLGDQSFSISAVRPLADGRGDLSLVLVQARTPWLGEEAAERSNRALVEAMNTHRAEWREVFDALAVQTAMDDAGTAWGTVYRRDEGYRSNDEETSP